MDPATKALLALVIAGVALAGAWVVRLRGPSSGSTLVFTGTCLFAVVAVAHFCEAFHLLPAFGWGQPDTPGHYIDLAAAVLGSLTFVAGICVMSLRRIRVPR